MGTNETKTESGKVGERESGGECPPQVRAPLTDAQKLKLAELALLSILTRIQRDKDVRHLVGVGTRSFDYLTAAYAAIIGDRLETVREVVIPGSNAIRHDTAERILAREGQ